MAVDERERNDERTPLLNGSHTNRHGDGVVKRDDELPSSKTSSLSAWLTRVLGPPNTLKILLAGFIISFSFSFTQVPIFYVFHLMECDVYYETHPPYAGTGDKCAINEIAAGTATQFSILGMSTTFCGTLNLFVTGWTVKKWGPRFALVLQTFIPAIRVSTQIIGVIAGGNAGITIIQSTQLITILGGPAGYILVVNTIAGELVEPMQRTAVFGQLQGCIMLGQAIALFLGGMVGDAFGIRRPFEIAFYLFLFSAFYAGTVIPYISPESLSDGKKNAGKGVKGFLAPLRILAPQRIRFPDGHVRKHYGVAVLCAGIFLGTLATGYAPILVQMYATAYFGFTQADNGWLMSGNALMRSFFLLLLFPKIIDWGRIWWVASSKKTEAPQQKPRPLTMHGQEEAGQEEPNTLARIPSHPQEFSAPTSVQAQEEPMALQQPNSTSEEDRTACRFDLFFLRWSLLVDGILTSVSAHATKGWHVYFAAFVLPFGSGTAPAAKGVITEMCPHSQRADALNAITLVENIARLATQGLFGFVFSALAEVDQAYLTFYVNAAIAVVGMAVLYLSHFPPLDTSMVEEFEDDDGEEDFDDNRLTRVTSHEAGR